MIELEVAKMVKNFDKRIERREEKIRALKALVVDVLPMFEGTDKHSKFKKALDEIKDFKDA
jgi:hypothetical protein